MPVDTQCIDEAQTHGTSRPHVARRYGLGGLAVLSPTANGWNRSPTNCFNHYGALQCPSRAEALSQQGLDCTDSRQHPAASEYVVECQTLVLVQCFQSICRRK